MSRSEVSDEEWIRGENNRRPQAAQAPSKNNEKTKKKEERAKKEKASVMVGLARGGSAVETRRYLLVGVVGRKEWTAREEDAGVGQTKSTNGETKQKKGKKRDRRRSARACSCSLADGEWRMTGRKCPRAASLNAVGQRVTE